MTGKINGDQMEDLRLQEVVNALQKKHNLDIESPFTFKGNGETIIFDCLIRGYGSKNGMIIDRYYSKIEQVQNTLIDMEFGYSCFDLRDGVEDLDEALEDWGKV